MAIANRPYGRVLRGHTIPYGALAAASDKLVHAYYRYGYQHDADLPPLPEFDSREEPPAPEEVCLAHELQDVVEQILRTLRPREAKVLRIRYGIGLTQDYTMEEVGRRLDVTRERIRQIEAKALRLLRYRRNEMWERAGYMDK